MAIQYSIFLCLAVIMTSQQITFAAPDLQQLIEFNSTVLDKFINNKIDNAFGDHPFLFNLNKTALEDCVKKMIKQIFADQPIIKMFGITVDSNRVVSLHRTTFQSSKKIAEVSIANPSSVTTSSNKLLAYRPRFNDWHNSNLAGIFLNIKELTCGSRKCTILSEEEDGFNKGQVFIGAGDVGNNFRVFSSTKNIPTYGFAIQGCPVFNNSCLPSYVSITIACYAPRDCK